MGDLQGLGGPAPAPQRPETFVQRAEAIFDQVDTDDDGFLSHGELRDARQNRNIRSHDAAAVEVMFRRRGDIESASNDEFGFENDGITRADLRALSGSDARAAQRDYVTYAGKIDRANRTLFPAGLASITPAAVDQGSIGDCYFLSAVAGLAATNPTAIRDMITDLGGGRYQVDFPRRSVTVTMHDADYARAADTPQGNWVAVLERAYMEVDPAYDSAGLMGGIRALTGHSSTTYVTAWPFSLDSIRDTLGESTREGRLMVASRTWSENGDLPSQHVYTILRYDAERDRVVIRNPWGSGGPNGDGIHELTPGQFRDQFDLVAIEDR